ncbi:MAG TPA: molybdopterin-dependent oxidoreductase, partial [Chthoniobacterales bacterium]
EELVAATTGLSPEAVRYCAETIGKGKRVSFWWTMGVNQSHEGTRTAQAIINIALMTGNIGRPGTGANSITGQCNAMGSRLFSNTTNLMGGHDFRNPAHREKVAAVLGIDVANIPQVNSLAYDQILSRIESGQIKGLWIVATNTAHSWINQAWARETLAKLDFLVVQDMYGTTETAKTADLLLPAAGWGEKEGTLINSERRLGLMKRVSRAPGLALSDFNIFRLIAERWGCGKMFEKWTSPEAAFQILKAVSRWQPCDISGIRDYQMIDDCGGIQWPFSASETSPPQVERRLFEDGVFYHADGRARFVFEAPRAVAESTDEEFPIILLTGRGTSAQWHTQTRTAKSDILRKLYPANIYVEINPADALRLQIGSGEKVWIRSRRAKISASAHITSTVRPGQIFIPMHYPELNNLTLPSFDPYSRQPSYKHCAVALRADLPERSRS